MNLEEFFQLANAVPIAMAKMKFAWRCPDTECRTINEHAAEDFKASDEAYCAWCSRLVKISYLEDVYILQEVGVQFFVSTLGARRAVKYATQDSRTTNAESGTTPSGTGTDQH